MVLSVETSPVKSPIRSSAARLPAAQRPSLRKNISWTFAGNVVNACCQWALLVVLTRWGSPEVAGVYALVLATVQPVFAFCSLQLREVQVTDARSEYRLGDYLLVRLLSMLVAVAAIAILAWTALADSVPPAVVVVFALVHAVDALTDLLHGQLQKDEQMERVARSLIVRGIGSFAVFAAVFVSTQSLMAAAIGLLLARGSVLCVYDVPLFVRIMFDPRERPLFSWRVESYLSLLRIGGAFAILAGVISLRGNVPRLLIWSELGDRELGTFVIIASLVLPFQLVTQAMYQSAFPRLARYFAAGSHVKLHQLMRRLILATAVLAAVVSLGAMAVGNLIVKHVFLIESPHAPGIIICMAVAAALQAAAKPSGVVARLNRSLGMVTAIQVAGVAVLFVLSSWLIPLWGIVGAAAAYALTSALTTAFVHTLVFCRLKLTSSETDADLSGTAIRPVAHET